MGLNCEVARDLVSLYKDGLASPVTMREVKEHIGGCAACAAYYREYDREVAAAHMMDAHTQPLPDLRKRYKALAKRMQTRDRTEKSGALRRGVPRSSLHRGGAQRNHEITAALHETSRRAAGRFVRS